MWCDLLLLILLLALLAIPLLFPVAELARDPTGFRALLEAPRIASLAENTLVLAVGAVLLAVPLGSAMALLIERGHVRGRVALRALLLIGAFIPLQVYAAGWQTMFGAIALPDAGGWRPWRDGLLPAIWVHAVAGIPWVAGFVVLALRTTDPQLEDDARLAGGTRAVVRVVLWPRVRLAALAGGSWVAVQALTESTATDLFMVRTFAEEVYFQWVGNPAGVAAAVAVTLPAWLIAAILAVVLLNRVRSVWTFSEPKHAPISDASKRRAFLPWLGVLILAGVPLAGLIARIREVGQLLRVCRVHGLTLADSLVWAAIAGLIAAALALPACWRARQSRPWAGFLLLLAAIAWVTPAPLVGLGLNALIGFLVSLDSAVLGEILYYRPSPLPGMWADVLRFFPIAVVVLWPAIRNIPQERIDAATLDGGRRAVWRAAIWPSVRASYFAAALAVAVLSLGEVVASKFVQPPGWRTFAQDLFDAMHYGPDGTVAAMCLLQIAATAALCAFFAIRARTG